MVNPLSSGAAILVLASKALLYAHPQGPQTGSSQLHQWARCLNIHVEYSRPGYSAAMLLTKSHLTNLVSELTGPPLALALTSRA